MQLDLFEKAFSDFLDSREYDQAENALFSIIRISFIAGWKAAGGEAPFPQKIISLMHKTCVAALVEIETDIALSDKPKTDH